MRKNKQNKKDKKCRECICAKYVEHDCILACGYICYLNPFNPVSMGLNGKHSDRKAHIEQRKS